METIYAVLSWCSIYHHDFQARQSIAWWSKVNCENNTASFQSLLLLQHKNFSESTYISNFLPSLSRNISSERKGSNENGYWFWENVLLNCDHLDFITEIILWFPIQQCLMPKQEHIATPSQRILHRIHTVTVWLKI